MGLHHRENLDHEHAPSTNMLGLARFFGDYFKGHTHPYNCVAKAVVQNSFVLPTYFCDGQINILVAQMMFSGVKVRC